MDRLISIGRTSGEARVAAFIMDIMERLEPLGLVVGNTFVMQLTQEQIGDVVGLTSIHVNRVLKTIEEKGLISRSNHSYTVHDPGALDRLASRPRRERAANQPWLPQPRP